MRLTQKTKLPLPIVFSGSTDQRRKKSPSSQSHRTHSNFSPCSASGLKIANVEGNRYSFSNKMINYSKWTEKPYAATSPQLDPRNPRLPEAENRCLNVS